MHGCDESMEVVDVAEGRINGLVIGDVIAGVFTSRGIDRAEPHGRHVQVGTQITQVVLDSC